MMISAEEGGYRIGGYSGYVTWHAYLQYNGKFMQQPRVLFVDSFSLTPPFAIIHISLFSSLPFHIYPPTFNDR